MGRRIQESVSAELRAPVAGTSCRRPAPNAPLEESALPPSRFSDPPAKPPTQSWWQAAQAWFAHLVSAFDIGANIDALQRGDESYTLHFEGEAFLALGAYGKSEISVQRTADGKYLVTSEGQVGLTAWGELGGRVGAHADIDGNAKLGPEVVTEMTFDTAGDAKRAAHLLANELKALAASGLSPAGVFGALLFRPSAEDLAFLAAHTSALELGGALALEGWAGLGFGKSKAKVGVFGDAWVETQRALRLEVEQGRVTQVTTVQREEGDAYAGAGLLFDDGRGKKDETFLTGDAFVGGDVRAAVVSTHTHALGRPLPVGDLMRRPADAFRTLFGALESAYRPAVRVELERSGRMAGCERGAHAEATFYGDLDALSQAGVLSDALHGRLKKAAEDAGRQMPVEAELKAYREVGVAALPSVSVMGVGVIADAEGLRREYEAPAWSLRVSQPLSVLPPRHATKRRVGKPGR